MLRYAASRHKASIGREASTAKGAVARKKKESLRMDFHQNHRKEKRVEKARVG